MPSDSAVIEITPAAARMLSEYLARIQEPSVVMVTWATGGSHTDEHGRVVPHSPGWIVGFLSEDRVTTTEVDVIDGFRVVVDPRGMLRRGRIVVRNGALVIERSMDA